MDSPTAEFSESKRAVLIALKKNPSPAPNEAARTQVFTEI